VSLGQADATTASAPCARRRAWPKLTERGRVEVEKRGRTEAEFDA
jgi:hypothetical protein